jgi:hypothetical protein
MQHDNRNPKFRTRSMIISAAVLIPALASRASLLLYDPMNYGGSGTTLATFGGAYGESGTFSTWKNTNAPLALDLSMSSTGLAYPAGTTLTGFGGTISDPSTGNTSQNGDFVPMSTPINTSVNGTYYISYLVNRFWIGNLPTGQAFLGVDFNYQETNPRAGAPDLTFGLGSAGSFRTGGDNGTNSTLPNTVVSSSTYLTSGTGDPSTGQTTTATGLVVGRVTVANGSISTALAFYSATSTIPTAVPTSWAVTSTVGSYPGIVYDNLQIRKGASVGTSVDEVLVGTTWADVTQANSWTGTGSNWSSASSWSNGYVPNAAGIPATLGTAVSGPTTVTLNQPVTLGYLTFSSPNTYTVAGQTLTMSGSSTSGISVTAGSPRITAPISLATPLTVALASGTSLSTSTIDGPYGVSVTGGTLAVSTRLSAASLTTSSTALVDLGEGGAVFSSMAEADVDALVFSWLNTGYGLGTTASVPYGTLGVILNDNGEGGPLYTTFDGVPVAQDEILVRYTYFGDTTLKGYVDGTDLANLLAGMAGGLTGWENGDTDYSGVVDGTDLDNLLGALAGQGAPFGSPSGPSGAVPEPATLGAASAALLCLGRRRRNPRA